MLYWTLPRCWPFKATVRPHRAQSILMLTCQMHVASMTTWTCLTVTGMHLWILCYGRMLSRVRLPGPLFMNHEGCLGADIMIQITPPFLPRNGKLSTSDTIEALFATAICSSTCVAWHPYLLLIKYSILSLHIFLGPTNTQHPAIKSPHQSVQHLTLPFTLSS